MSAVHLRLVEHYRYKGRKASRSYSPCGCVCGEIAVISGQMSDHAHSVTCKKCLRFIAENANPEGSAP